MSFRTKSLPRQKRFIHSPRQHFSTLKASLKNVNSMQYATKLRNLHSTKILNSSISPQRHIKKINSTKSHYSPFRATLKKDYVYEGYLKSSDTSIETFGKLSSEQAVDSSQEYILESPLLISIKNTFPDSIEYEDELVMHRQQNNKRKSKIKRLEEKTSKVVKKDKENYRDKDRIKDKDKGKDKDKDKEREIEKESGKSTMVSERELKYELQRQKEIMEKEHRQALERQKSEILEEYQREFEVIQDHIINKLKFQQKKVLARKEKKQQELYSHEKQILKKEHENKLRKRISEIVGDYERQLDRVQDEVIWLKKQNDTLKSTLDDHTTRTGISISTHKNDSTSNSTIDLNKQYNEICKSYSLLQSDYLELKKQKNNNLCIRCKAFTETNEELANKITRIREYIDLKN